MSLTKHECALLRALINRSVLGPAWFNDEPSTLELRSVVGQLRFETREWLMANIVRELQAMLPADQRVSFSGIRQLLPLAQQPGRVPEAAAHAAPPQARRHSDEPAPSQAAGWMARHESQEEDKAQAPAPEPEEAPGTFDTLPPAPPSMWPEGEM